MNEENTTNHAEHKGIRQRLEEEKEHLHEKREELHERIKRRNKRRVQILSVCVLLGVLVLATVACIPLIKSLRSENGMEALRQNLEENYSGVSVMLIFVGLQALQVVIAVVPPVQVVGGMLFGWFWGFVLSFAGTLLGTLVIFVLVKRFGRPLVEAFVDEKLIHKYKFLQDERKLTRILMILYLIPGIVPKDVISYLVPLTPVKKKDFFMYVMPCRIPAILMSTVFGTNAISGNFKTAAVILAAIIVLGIVGFIFKEPILAKLNKHRKPKA